MANTRLHIRLFQSLRVSVDDGPPLDLGSPKAKSLFAYLVLNHAHAVDRRRLSFILWPRATEAAARRNLRQYLHRLRRSLEPIDPDGRLLSTDGHNIQFQGTPGWHLDVDDFEAASSLPAEDLAAAVTLYTGDLLQDIYDDWVAPERDRLSRLYHECLLRLIEQYDSAGQYQEAIRFAEFYLAEEKYLESTYLLLMRLHYQMGNRGAVNSVFNQLQTMLRDELQAEPLASSKEIYRQMLSGEYVPQDSGLVSTLATPLVESLQPALADQVTLLPFVGRASELAWLKAACQSAHEAQGGFYVLQGESGVGKTRLIVEWITQACPNNILFHGLAHEFESMIPYAPLAEALRNAAQTSFNWDWFSPPPAWLPALSPLLPELPNILPDQFASRAGYDRQYHLVEALSNFFLTLTRHNLVILFIDNLHWLDRATWEFLAYLSHRAGKARLLIIGAIRTEDLSKERGRQIRDLQHEQLLRIRLLDRLSQEETYLLVGQLMEDPDLNPLFLRRIFEETEGNPFFIIETIRAVREAGGDWTQSVPTDATGQRPFYAIPLQIQSVIESRLDKLGDDSHSYLGIAAAIGREFSFSLLQTISNTDTENLLNALDEWLIRGLVRETRDGYDFTHEKFSQVAYQQLSRARRQWIHLQIGNTLVNKNPETDPAEIARHFYLSSEPGRALPFLAQAGRRALRVRSYAEAREFGLQAIGLLGRFPTFSSNQRLERLDLNLQLAQAYALSGAFSKALQMLQETERLADSLGDIDRLAQIFLFSSRIFWLHGNPQTAGDYARRTLRHAEELKDEKLRLAALRMLGRVNIVLSHYDDAIALLLRYVDLVQTQTQPDLVAVFGYLGVAYARVGSWQRAINAAQHGLDLASKSPTGAIQMVARMQLAFVYAELREWQQALSIAEPMRELWREEGMTPYAFILRTVVGRCLAHTQAGSAGPAEIQAALLWASEVDYRVQIHLVHLYLAQAQFQANEPQDAAGTVEGALGAAVEIGDRWAEAVAYRTQAQIAMAQRNPDWPAVERSLITSMNLLRAMRARPDLARTYLALRRLYDRAGQSAWAVDCHFRATTIFEELGMSEELRIAQGQPAGDRTGAVVIPNLLLTGPNTPSK
jgi:DNA-binding SARP family transcriptional activator